MDAVGIAVGRDLHVVVDDEERSGPGGDPAQPPGDVERLRAGLVLPAQLHIAQAGLDGSFSTGFVARYGFRQNQVETERGLRGRVHSAAPTEAVSSR